MLIILSHLVLGMFAFYLGKELRELEISLSNTFIYVPFALFVTISFIYPTIRWSRLIGRTQMGFYVLKACYGIIFACSFAAMIYVFNQVNFLPSRFASYATLPHRDSSIQKKISASEILASLQSGDKKNLSKFEKRVLKKEFRKQLKNFSHAKQKMDEASSNKTLKIILVIVLAVGLIFLLGALACGISCGGAELLAGIIAVAGLIGIIWITIVLIRNINKKGKTDRPKEPPKETGSSG